MRFFGRGGGFNLLELVILLLILGVGAGIAVDVWFGQPDVTLDNAVRLLARDLQEAQSSAALEASDVHVRFLADGDGYEVIGADGQPLEAPTGAGDFRRVYSHDAIFRGVAFQQNDFEAAGVRYDVRGFAEDGGVMVLGFEGAQRTLVLEDGTGLITIEGLEESWVDDGGS